MDPDSDAVFWYSADDYHAHGPRSAFDTSRGQ